MTLDEIIAAIQSPPDQWRVTAESGGSGKRCCPEPHSKRRSYWNGGPYGRSRAACAYLSRRVHR